jgi:DNA-directed RNA polymerase specialized sigma24 family protein
VWALDWHRDARYKDVWSPRECRESAIMTETTAFADFIRRIRAGDDQAARELVERYEPVVRREVRMRLGDPRLNRQFDGSDVCQSVMASFFVRLAAGQFDLEEPDQLPRLLVVMARRKVANLARRHRASRRDYRRLETCDPADLEGRSAPTPSPKWPCAILGGLGK